MTSRCAPFIPAGDSAKAVLAHRVQQMCLSQIGCVPVQSVEMACYQTSRRRVVPVPNAAHWLLPDVAFGGCACPKCSRLPARPRFEAQLVRPACAPIALAQLSTTSLGLARLTPPGPHRSHSATSSIVSGAASLGRSTIARISVRGDEERPRERADGQRLRARIALSPD